MCGSVTDPGKPWSGGDVKGIWVSIDIMKLLNQPRRDPARFWTTFGEVMFPYCLSLWCVAKSTSSSLPSACSNRLYVVLPTVNRVVWGWSLKPCAHLARLW